MLQKQRKDLCQQLEECMSDIGMSILVHKVYCQLKEFVMKERQVLTSETEPHWKMRNLHSQIKQQISTLGGPVFHVDLQMHQ